MSDWLNRSERNEVKVGTSIDMCGPKEAVELAVLAERLGYRSLWFPDHLIDTGGMKVEPWSTIGAISMVTSKIIMCTAVTDTQRAHPARTAHSVATLSELSNGRVWLGIGAGEAMNLTPFGLPFDKPSVRARRLEEAVRVVRLLWGSSRKSPVNFGGTHFSLTNAWMDLEITHSPPIYIGAHGGPRMMEIVGKYADGWISWVNTPDTFRQRMKVAREAAAHAGRRAEQVEGAAWVFVSMASGEEDIAKAISYAKISLLMEAHTLRLMGIKLPDAITTPYQSMLVTDEADRLLAELQDAVPDEVALSCLAFGSPSQIVERIERFKDAGASHIIVEFTERGKAPLEDFSRDILGRFNR